MKKKEIFIDGIAEYSFEKEGSNYYLKYNLGEQWQQNVRDTIAMHILDTGNELKIMNNGQGKKNTLNYSEALHLNILLKLIHSEENYIFEIAEKINF